MAKTKPIIANEGVVFNLKPQLTLAMKLAATFAITYYGLLLIYEIISLNYIRFFFDSYYLDEASDSSSSDLFILISEIILTALLVFSLIWIFLKKSGGKAIFVSASLLLIIFQLVTTGITPWYKYALEILLILIITPIRVKKKIKTKLMTQRKKTEDKEGDKDGEEEKEESPS